MLDLGTYVPYLLNRAGARIAASFSGAIRSYGITLPIWRVLAALHQQDGQRVGGLSDTTAIEISTLSRVLDLMRRKGLAARHRADVDARVVTVHLTQAGRDLTERIIPLARHYESVALADFTRAEADQLRALLNRLYGNLERLPQQTELTTPD